IEADQKHKNVEVQVAPSARKTMVEAGISQNEITGSGRQGRIMKEDVKSAILDREQNQSLEKVSQASIPVNATSTNQNSIGREERIKMSRLRQTIAKRLKDSQNTAAMLTTYNEVDMTAVIDLRQEYKELFEKKHGVRLGFMSFFTKACCQGLKEIPTPTGLVVPVIRNVDGMSFSEIEKQIAEKGLRARDGSLSMADMQDGTFTISNGGVYGSLMSSPILNPPQSGILGMHKIQDRPVAINGEIVIRPMMYLALSYDHRIVDGKGAVTFLVRVKEALEDPRRLLMDL
ncbi:MAG: dihydrolipoamide succinyltransferase, partial [Rhodobacteraceae bacterium]|nr:dihydrolipoamide succinyltransferase [Paracoccaceae bacterium]